MLLKEYVRAENPLLVMNAEFGLSGLTFGIRGHSPLSFRMGNEGLAHIDIVYKDRLLGSVGVTKQYHPEETYEVHYQERTDELKPDAQQRVRRAAEAVIEKIDLAFSRYTDRLQRINDDIFDIIGPKDCNKAVVRVNTQESMRAAYDLLYPGVAESILPPNVEMVSGEYHSSHTDFVIRHTETVHHHHIRTTIARIRYPTTNDHIALMGPGNRKTAPLSFLEKTLFDASAHCQRITQSPELLADMMCVAERHAGLIAEICDDQLVLRSTRHNVYQRQVLMTSHDMKTNTVPRRPERSFTIPGTELEVGYRRDRFLGMRLFHKGEEVFSTSHGFMSGVNEEMKTPVITAAFIEIMRHDPNMLTHAMLNTDVIDTIRAHILEADENTINLNVPDTSTAIDVYL